MVRSLRNEKDRLSANQDALLADVEYYKSESGKSAAAAQQLTLTHSEFKKHYDEIAKTAKDLGIKLNRLESASTTRTETKIKVVTDVRDSIVYRDSIRDVLKVFNWKDPWTRVDGTIDKDSVDIDVQTTDTLVQVVHRVPHKFLFFKWGTKAIRQDVTVKNPHTKITYTEYIELKK